MVWRVAVVRVLAVPLLQHPDRPDPVVLRRLAKRTQAVRNVVRHLRIERAVPVMERAPPVGAGRR